MAQNIICTEFEIDLEFLKSTNPADAEIRKEYSARLPFKQCSDCLWNDPNECSKYEMEGV